MNDEWDMSDAEQRAREEREDAREFVKRFGPLLAMPEWGEFKELLSIQIRRAETEALYNESIDPIQRDFTRGEAQGLTTARGILDNMMEGNKALLAEYNEEETHD